MSQGLKPYSKLINFEVPNAGKIYVNTANFYKNAHIVIPLFSSEYTDGINLSLIMSLNDINSVQDTGYCGYVDISEFGNGVKLNLNKELKCSTMNGFGFYSKDCDFSFNYYDYINENDAVYLRNIIGNDYYKNNSERVNFFEYHDESDNIYYFEADPLDNFRYIQQKYPSIIHSKVGDYDKYILELDDNNCISTITGHSGEKAVFEIDNDEKLVKKIEIFRPNINGDYDKYHTIMFEYSFNRLNKIKHILYNESNTTYSASYSYSENYSFTITDDISKYFIRLDLTENNKIISIKDGYDDNYNGNINLSLSYYDDYTIITDNNYIINEDNNKREIEHHFINKNNCYLPHYDYDHLGVVRCYLYETDKNLISFDSGNILVYGDDIDCDKNIITNGYFKDLDELYAIDSSTLYITEEYDSCFDRDCKFKALCINDNIYREEINYNGTNRNRLIFSLWRRCKDYSNSSICTVSLSFYNDGELIKTEIFEFNNDSTLWIFECKELIIDMPFDKIVFEIDATDAYEWYFGAISLLNRPYNSYTYNDDTTLKTGYENGEMFGYEYLSGNTIGTKYTEKTFKDYKYDEKNRLYEAIDSFNIKNKVEYNDKNKIVKKIHCSDSGKYIKSQSEYNENENDLLNEEVLVRRIDTDNNITLYDIDLFTRLTNKITNEKQEVTEYNYNNFNQLEYYKVYKGSNNSKIDYGYYNNNYLLKSLSVATNNKYIYHYDTEGKIKKIELVNNSNDNSTDVISYVYQNEEAGESGIHTGNIKTMQYGLNGFKYIYSYDDYNRLIRVETNHENEIRVESTYEYNFLGALIKYNNIIDNYNITYKYDNNCNLCEIVDSRGITNKYSYDDKNELILKQTNCDNKIFVESFSNPNRTYMKPSKNIVKNIKHISNSEDLNTISRKIYFNMFDEDNNRFSFDYGSPYSPKKAIKELIVGNYLSVNDISSCMYNKYSYVSLDQYSDRIIFQNSISEANSPLGSVGFWFRPSTNNNNKVLFSIGDGDFQISFKVSIYDNKLMLSTITNDEMGYGFSFYSTNTINVNSWNYFNITWDKPLNTYRIIYKLNLNGKTTSANSNAIYNLLFHNNTSKFVIGGEYVNGVINSSTKFIGDVTTIFVSDGFALSEKNVQDYYETTKMIFNETINDPDTATVNLSNKYNVSNYLNYDYLDIIPLNDSLFSLKNKKPYISIPKELSNYDNDPFFEFNHSINRYVYHASGATLAYDYNLSNEATLFCKVYFNEIDDNSYIFENIDKNSNVISLYVDSNKKVNIMFNGTNINTNIEVALNKWINVSLSWKRSYRDKDINRIINLRVDNNSYTTEVIDNSVYDGFITYIGTNKVSEEIKTLNGQIEMVVISSSNINNMVTNIINTLKTDTNIYRYNDLGLLISKEISTDGSTKLEHLYEYNNIEDTESIGTQRIGTTIEEEQIVLNNQTIELRYEYDSSNLLKKVYENDILYKEYEYNYKNELIVENDHINGQAKEYNILNNGNIGSIYKTNYGTDSSVETISFEYNNQFSKDILTKITKDGIINSVIYNDSYFANPTTLNLGGVNLNLEWKGTKLAKAHISNIEHIEYKYDDLGNRIAKNLISTILESIKHKYFYEGGRLIKEEVIDNQKGDTDYKYFDYDVNGLLLSMTINNNKYYYVRDIFSTIIGLTDSSGNLVTKYHYDAYGNIIKIDGNLVIANQNPFIYKGYYYDVETQLFYCNSRYYSPELCRFISPDDVDYIDPESINGLNLYCYCLNNPIMYADPSGHSTILFIVGLISSVVIGGLVSGGIAAGTAAISGGDIDTAFWGGFATGALSSLAVGVGMAIGGGVGLLVCGGMGFAAGFGGNVLTQSISSYNATGSINIDLGDALFAGVTNSLVCMATMGSMNLWMSDSFNPALSGKTFGSRFVEFMSFDGANTAASIYFGVMYGLFDGTMSLAKSLIEQSNNKTRNTNALLNY